MNHLPLSLPPSDSLFYSPMDHHHHHHHPFFYSNYHHHHHHHSQNDDDSDNSSSNNLNSTTNNNNNNNNNNDNRSETTSSQNSHSQATDHHREHMFEKPLTPSDVGKLNRLVIPKQHAEKYFPLAGVSSSTSTTVDGGGGASNGGGGGGVLLGFEDESGKCWRFRYSYWNSSQSYVLTKGWSRYVKEKKLDAGDVVLFERHRFEPDRFFIGWRRRRGTVPVQPLVRPVEEFSPRAGWGQAQRYNNNAAPMQVHHHQAYAVPHRINSFPYHHHQQTDCFHAAGVRQQSQKAGGRSGGSKKLRLFGVNLECQLEEGTIADDIDTEPQTSDGSSLSSQGPAHGSGFGPGFGSASGSGLGPTPYIYVGYPLNHHDQMDMNFPLDVNQMRNRLG